MKRTPIYLATVALLIAGCRRGNEKSLQREQQNYDVVQEGQSSSAVTSTITAPGEPLPPSTTAMTSTNLDTTTAFTLPQVATAPTSTQPGTIAGTLTIPSNSGPMIGYPANPPKPRPRPAPKPAEPPRTATTDTTSTSEGPPQPPPATSTTPPSTDTAPPPPSDTQPPPTTTTT